MEISIGFCFHFMGLGVGQCEGTECFSTRCNAVHVWIEQGFLTFFCENLRMEILLLPINSLYTVQFSKFIQLYSPNS